MRVIAGFFVFLMCFAAQARERLYYEAIITMAAEISTVEVFKDQSAYSLEINGGIERLKVWDGALAIIPDNTDFSIVLNSPGGPVEETEVIDRHIRNKCHAEGRECVITTVVHGKCVSVCTAVFSMGDVRAAGKDAVFGFHGAATFNDFGGYELAPASRVLKQYELSPVSPGWFQSLADRGIFSTVDITWFARGDLSDGNYVNEWL
jgi:hypothetical protein